MFIQLDDNLGKNQFNFVMGPNVDLSMHSNHQHVNPAFIEIPRNAKLFRVVVDRKLGIDWEHSVRSSEEGSLQTY